MGESVSAEPTIDTIVSTRLFVFDLEVLIPSSISGRHMWYVVYIRGFLPHYYRCLTQFYGEDIKDIMSKNLRKRRLRNGL